MKMLVWAALALSALVACAPASAQHAGGSDAPAGYAPEQACVTWTGATIGSGSLVPCPAAAGTGSGAANSAASATGSAVPAAASYTGYLGADGNLHGWLGDNLGHPAVSIFGTPTFNLDTADAANLAAPPTTFASIAAQVTITTGGTAQNLFGGVRPTNGYEVCNPSASDAWLSETTGAAAGAGYRVPASGGCYSTPAGVKPGGVVSAIAADTGHPLSVKSW